MSTLSPEVSVLLAVYNGERHIRAAIESVLAQDSDNWELVIVDDGSTDSTPQLLSAQMDPRIRVLRTETAKLRWAICGQVGC
jgi:glycosyltransferase involved in cell wall biosynthesis